MDIRKYQPVKRTTPVEIKSVERARCDVLIDVLIEEFSEARFNLDYCSNELC